MMKSFYEASFLNDEIDLSSEFALSQSELMFRRVISHKNREFSFAPLTVEYRCSFIKNSSFSPEKPTILIPIKDNSRLLAFTLKNLKDNNVTSYANVLVIDDRSEENIKKITINNQHNYLRVDNDKGFNFSMLNNIAAKICHQLGNKTIILWNSDLWTLDEESFVELLKRHKDYKSKISGSKLVYPPKEKSMSIQEDSENIRHYFPNYTGGKWRNTVQFGGDTWYFNGTSTIIHSPGHYKRFAKITDPLVNCDRGVLFITGALHVWDLNLFIELGGLNPSLSKVFQDVDICLRAYRSGHCPMYFGKDLYFYHDESLSMHTEKKKKNDSQFKSDHFLFGKIWNEKLGEIIAFGES